MQNKELSSCNLSSDLNNNFVKEMKINEKLYEFMLDFEPQSGVMRFNVIDKSDLEN